MSEPIFEENSSNVSFKDLGLCSELCLACEKLGFVKPTSIQTQSIPFALDRKDLIALAMTGSGKTAAFVLPILQHLLDCPTSLFALILTPTRELAIQISEQCEALGAFIGLKTAVLVGGLDLMAQAVSLSKKPHIVVGTPGRVADHLQNTKGFNLNSVKFLVLDEADKLLNMDFGKEIDLIVSACPQERTTLLFSATMTNKVQKLQRACLRKDAVKIQVSAKYQTVDTLIQEFLFIPAAHKDTYLQSVLKTFSGNSIIIFTETTSNASKVTLFLNKLGFKAVALFGKLTQDRRLESLNKFKSKGKNILVATEVASRGLDIPSVDVVINYDVPSQSKNYIHRVGRTARAGRAGRALTLVTQYDVVLFQRVESLLGKKLESFQIDKETVMQDHEQVCETIRAVTKEIKDQSKESEDDERLDDDGEIVKIKKVKKNKIHKKRKTK
jgi:ATP-dependent RNA helicase DDX47/RRP3